ncbi:MAG: acyl-CoA dehydrogenase family protein, partial [Acetobacteraceae bacterium]
MDFAHSERVEALCRQLSSFMESEIHPNEAAYAAERTALGAERWQPSAVVERLKERARAAGLWNLFFPDAAQGLGLSNLDYAPLAEIMGAVPWASEVFNCSAPDTGNMEILHHFGTRVQQD